MLPGLVAYRLRLCKGDSAGIPLQVDVFSDGVTCELEDTCVGRNVVSSVNGRAEFEELLF